MCVFVYKRWDFISITRKVIKSKQEQDYKRSFKLILIRNIKLAMPTKLRTISKTIDLKCML